MSNKDYFSKEYTPDSSTEDTSEETSVLKESIESKDDFEIEQNKYGDSKPKRIIIKAKIIDG